MHKTRLVLIIILFINLNIFSQAEQQVIISDTINDLSTTNDVVDLESPSKKSFPSTINFDTAFPSTSISPSSFISTPGRF